MHIPPSEERIKNLPFLGASGQDSEGIGRCDTDNNVTFRCPECWYALTTCGDCFPDKDSIPEAFYDKHFRERKVGASPAAKNGDCPSCSHTGKGNGTLEKTTDGKIPRDWGITTVVADSMGLKLSAVGKKLQDLTDSDRVPKST